MLKLASITVISALLATTPAIAGEYMGKTSDGADLYFDGDHTIFRDVNGWYRFNYTIQDSQGTRQRKAITGACLNPEQVSWWITVVDGYPVIVPVTSKAASRLIDTVCSAPLDDH